MLSRGKTTIQQIKQQQLTEFKVEIDQLSQSYSSFFDFCRISVGHQSYIAKICPPKFANFNNREAHILNNLTHPTILHPCQFQLPAHLSSILKDNMLLFPEALRGDLNSFVRRNGGLSDLSCKWIMKQVVEAMEYCYEKVGSYHPNLKLENILLDEECNIKLCGWSNSQSSPSPNFQELLFRLGDLTISLIISRNVYSSKSWRTGCYAKFLSSKHIHKLFQQLEKSTKKIIKGFTMSQELIEFASILLLKKASSLQAVKDLEWLKNAPSLAQVQADIKAQEDKVKKILYERREKEKQLSPEDTEVQQVISLSEETQSTSSESNIRRTFHQGYEKGWGLIEVKGTIEQEEAFFKTKVLPGKLPCF